MPCDYALLFAVISQFFVYFLLFSFVFVFYHVYGGFHPNFHYLPLAVAFNRPAHKFGCMFSELIDIFL